MSTLKIKIEKEIPMEILENIFVTAIEGGSNYWCDFSEKIYKKIMENKFGEPFSVALYKCICEEGMVVPVRDAEDPSEVIGKLDFSKFSEHIEKIYTNGDGWAMDSELDESGDANSSDVVFQYLVMGELVYG